MSSPNPETLPLGGAESLLKGRIRELLEEARERTLELVAGVSDDDMERVHSKLMSPLVWDLGHIAAFEDLWLCHRAGGLAPLRPELFDVYDATDTPRARRGDLPYLRLDEARAYLAEVRERALGALEDVDLTGDDPLVSNGFVWELVIRHEHQHNETMLQTLQLAQPGVFAPTPRDRPPLPLMAAQPGMVRIDGGEIELGAPRGGFAYDNERPRHTVELAPFEIDRLPVRNGDFLDFVEAGGYERSEWWSDEGWAWRGEAGATRPLFWTADGRERRFDRIEPIDPSLPVMHVSWFEAEAYARSRGKRLPTEAEWERAATASGGEPLPYPWGADLPGPERANVDQLGFGPHPAGSYPAGASVDGVEGLIGDAWEWTASEFDAYPGFRAFPYDEYSAIFYRRGFKVLRGGSWATRARVATPTFRNWDFPDRRQIFAGFRCARDA